MAFQDLLPYLYSTAEHQQERRDQWWDAQRKQRIADNMASANQIKRQLGYVNNITHALALLTDPEKHTILPGHEAEAARLQEQLKQYNVPELTANLGQMEGFIQKLYDPNFNPQTGMEQRSPLRALGEKLHLVKPQATPLAQPPVAAVDQAQYETKLTPEEEQQFQQWKAQYAPQDSGQDYDLRGAFKAGLQPDPQTGHWPDTFKKPNHPTFSTQSMYASQRPELAGTWQGDQYIKPQPQPKTAGELIKGLQDIRKKYDITPLGLEEGEKELAAEETAREQEGAASRTMDFIAEQGKKRNWTDEQIQEAQEAQFGIKPATGKKPTTYQGTVTVDGQQKAVVQEIDTAGDITLKYAGTGEEVPAEVADTFKLTPKSAAAQKPVRAWRKDKSGRIFSVLLDPNSNQVQPGTENYDILPPGSMVGRITTGYYHFIGQDNQVHQVQETRTSGPNYGGAGTGAGPAKPRAGAGPTPSKPGTTPATATSTSPAAAAPVSPKQQILGPAKPNAPQTAAQKDYDDIVELQTRANNVTKNKRRGMHVALEQHAIIEALQTATSRRFIMAAAQYMVNTNLANTFDQAISQLSGTGELPSDVWKQVLQAIGDLQVGRKEKLRTSGMPVPETEEEQRKRKIREGLQQELNQPTPPK